MKFIVLAVLIAGAFAIEFDSKLDNTWANWKQTFYRVYDEEENSYRRAIWEEKVGFINRHNLEESLGLHTFTVGLNQFSDWTHVEYLRILGRQMKPENFTDPQIYVAPENAPNAATVDWRTKGYVTPIKNQGQCGSCWAFGSAGSLEGQMFKKSGQLQNYAEQQLLDCSSSEGNHGCNGGMETFAFNYVKKITNQGSFLDIQSCYPYTAKQGTCHPNTAATCKGGTCTGYVSVTPHTEAALTTAITSVGPLSVAIDASRPSFNSYKSGVYYDAACSSKNLDHAVLLVGYGTDTSDYWIVKNSWGTTWGQQGYVQMARNRNNNCGIATDSNYPTV